ncbi:glycosyltransferase family 2 protein [Nonlabens marinus]|uniref:Glycosyl transferase, group 2 family protein n=1 Tax=Nonlabens marinus S1-08 TaxID=1454201 RepID=W8VRP7_9FLAO|nr:glycosyltransferase family 2 protein [Nonlabens marinus]BAO55735.1 glycosyl transferase, group 2 family protein [Nonlabens marinus S1-08]
MVKNLVSIIIPVFNRAGVIPDTINSLINQSYTQWECIVVDDGSIDSTVEVVSAFAKADKRIKLLERPSHVGKGANACRNLGFSIAKGSYVQWLDSDDALHEDKLRIQMEAAHLNDKFTLFTAAWGSFESTGELAGLEIITRLVYNSFPHVDDFLESISSSYGFLPPHVYLMHKDLVQEAGGWNDKLSINQDGEFMSRVFVKSSQVVYCDGSIAYYRNNTDDLQRTSVLNSHGKAVDLIKSWKMIEKVLNIRYKKQLNYVFTAKQLVYDRIKSDFPELIAENKEFFESTAFKQRHWLGNYFRRLKQFING